MNDTSPRLDSEDTRKHLDFIQAVITRMSAASSAAKAWLLPVVTAAYGYALTQKADSVALLGISATLLFAYLDANYLRQEKRYRCLYTAVAVGDPDVEIFTLNTNSLPTRFTCNETGGWKKAPEWLEKLLPGPSVWRSWSIAPVYLSLLVVGLVIVARVADVTPGRNTKMNDAFWGFSATTWTAIYTLMTAGLLLVAIVAALYAKKQVQVSRTAQSEATRPYVIVTAESSPIGWRVMDLVVRNIGQRPAYNVKVSLSPEPLRATETLEAPISEVRWLNEVIPMLAPGQELRTFYDFMDERLNSGNHELPKVHDYSVEYDEAAGSPKNTSPDHCDLGVVDLIAMSGAMQPDVYNIHHVASELRDIKNEIAKKD